jgi:hypothetical protein
VGCGGQCHRVSTSGHEKYIWVIRVCKGLLCNSRGGYDGDNLSLDAGRRGGITDFSHRQQSTEYGIVGQTASSFS